mgnify:CR=1 FL=1|tara:strand:- start:787 stop:1233 length:447 start_codon:yes stop_codon:yes gene_type:complete
METINATETMKTITDTKGELVNIINGLYGVQTLQGKKFSLIVSKNISILTEALKDLEKAGKPSDEFMKLAEQVNEISTNSENEEEAKKQIDKLEEENSELVESRKSQMSKVQVMMEKEASVELHIINEDILPEDITAQQLNKMIKIIE